MRGRLPKVTGNNLQPPRADSEIHVNDYSPLLLMLWQANMDILFIAESSLALAYYVTAYVTKGERSNMQEIWQEVSANKSITAICGVSAFAACARVSVDSTRLPIYFWVNTFVKNRWSLSGLMPHGRTRENADS